MDASRVSKTAQTVAALRAIHQVADSPIVFEDSVVAALLGGREQFRLAANSSAVQSPGTLSLRAFVLARSRFAEEQLAQAVGRGATQYVILGAGFDTFAYRNPYEEAVRVFEVDVPGTQAEKRRRLEQIGIATAATCFVPLNLESDDLMHALLRFGLRMDQVTFVSWMGVPYYLTETTFWNTIEALARLPQQSEVVFDLFVPTAQLPEEEQHRYQSAATVVSDLGEPYTLHLDPASLMEQLERHGFVSSAFDDHDLNSRYFQGRSDELAVSSSLVRLISAIRQH